MPDEDYHRVANVSAGTILADTVTGCSVALLSSMPVTIIDTSVMRKVNGQCESLGADLKNGFRTLLTKPRDYFFTTPKNWYAKSYRVVVAVYGTTYVCANLTRSYCEAHDIPIYYPVLFASAGVNTLGTVWKDTIFLTEPRIVGKIVGTPYVPVLSKCMFAARDTFTVAAAFVIVDKFAEAIRYTVGESQIGIKRAKDLAQFLTPTLAQFITTPVHISSIAYSKAYPDGGFQEMKAAVKADYFGATFSRMGRVMPSFVLGGMMNTKMRSATTEYAEKNGY